MRENYAADSDDLICQLAKAVTSRTLTTKGRVRLGGFVLAVELVAAWLAVHSGVTCEGFLQRLGLEDLEALDAVAADAEVMLRRHHERRIEAVLGPTLAELDPRAYWPLMEYATLLPPDQVPLVWLKTLIANDFPEIAAAPKENYVPRASRGELTSLGGSRSTWLKDVAGGARLSCKTLLPRRSAMLILAIDLGKAKSLACWYQTR